MDLTPYVGRWVALINGQVAGVGHTAVSAQRLAQRNRPKERITTQFVEPPDGELLPLSPLMAQLQPIFKQIDTPIFLVGGAVRDGVMGQTSHDLDFAVPENAIKTAFQVADALGVPAYVLDRDRDTGRVMWQETSLDFARFRGMDAIGMDAIGMDAIGTDAIGADAIGDDLEVDLRDRDFTINAMALPVAAKLSSSVIDPTGGMADIAARIIRPTHPDSIMSDPARILRALRQSLSFGFTLAYETAVAVHNAIPKLNTISNERIRDELLKLLETAVPHQALIQLHEFGLLTAVLPEIAALDPVTQSPPHHEAVLAHTVSVLRWLVQLEEAVVYDGETTAPPIVLAKEKLAPFTEPLCQHWAREVDGGFNGRLLLRLGALFHDVGKAETKTVEENGRIRFLGHDAVGAKIVGRRLRRLALSNDAITHIKAIVKGHMRPLQLVTAQGGNPIRRTIFRYFRDTKAAGLDVGILSLADHLATHNGAGHETEWENLVDLIAALFDNYFNRKEESVAPPPLLNGRDLMHLLQLKPGPEIGRLLRLIQEAQATGEVTTKEEAILFAENSRQ